MHRVEGSKISKRNCKINGRKNSNQKLWKKNKKKKKEKEKRIGAGIVEEKKNSKQNFWKKERNKEVENGYPRHCCWLAIERWHKMEQRRRKRQINKEKKNE